MGGLFAGEGFVEIEEGEADGGHGGVFGGGEGGVAWGGADFEEGFGGGGVLVVEGELFMPRAGEDGGVVRGWGASEDAAEGEVDACGGVRRGFEGEFGEDAGGFGPRGVVEGGEGVEGGGGDGGSDLAGLACGDIEHVDWADGASPERVETAAVEVGAGAGWVGEVAFFGDGEGFPDVRGLIGIDRFAADLAVEEGGGGEGVVAEDETGHADSGGAGHETVFGVAGEEVGAHAAGLAVGAAGDDEADHVFEAPAGVAEFDGEPVEEVLVDGHFALDAEVFGGFDEACTEEELPEPVDLDAGCQWVIRLEEPLGEAETVARGVGGEGREEAGGVSGDGVGGSEVAAAVEDFGLAGLFIAHDHDAGEILAEVVEGFFGGLGFAAGVGEGSGGEIAGDVVAEFGGFFFGAIGIADDGGDVVGESGAGSWLRGGGGGETEAA